jgi:hypothetical protein
MSVKHAGLRCGVGIPEKASAATRFPRNGRRNRGINATNIIDGPALCAASMSGITKLISSEPVKDCDE